jgi:hypothetical protein
LHYCCTMAVELSRRFFYFYFETANRARPYRYRSPFRCRLVRVMSGLCLTIRELLAVVFRFHSYNTVSPCFGWTAAQAFAWTSFIPVAVRQAAVESYIWIDRLHCGFWEPTHAMVRFPVLWGREPWARSRQSRCRPSNRRLNTPLRWGDPPESWSLSTAFSKARARCTWSLRAVARPSYVGFPVRGRAGTYATQDHRRNSGTSARAANRAPCCVVMRP